MAMRGEAVLLFQRLSGAQEMRGSIFISYSHHDEAWRRIFEKELKLGAHKADVEIWSDTLIPAGDEWRKAIEEAVLKSRVALLLVSHEFIKSDFIRKKELKDLIWSHRLQGLKIFWIPITELDPYELKYSELGVLQAAWDLKQPLRRLTGRDRQIAIHEICGQLIPALGLPADTGPDVGDRFMKAAKDLLWGDYTIKPPIATGDFSVILEAERQRDHQRVVVKTIVPSHRREWLGPNFLERAQLVQYLQHPSLIRVVEIRSTEECVCVVSDYVAAPTVEAVLNASPNKRLASDKVANILHQVADGCAALHRKRDTSGEVLLMGPLRPSNVFGDETENVQVSTVRISHETMRSCAYRPSLLLEDESLTYLTPERYEGKMPGAASDQYHVALLGLELLTGSPPVKAETFSDLKRKEQFFERPHEFFCDLRIRDPALSFVLAKMLEREPTNRWASMQHASAALDRVAQGKLPDELRSTAKAHYRKNLRGKTEFYRLFYEKLCQRSKRALELFSGKDLAVQYHKLDEAMHLLLDFRAEDEPTTLFQQVEQHAKHKLQSCDFDAFRQAFLDTLAELPGEKEPYVTDAWRAILAAGVSYMANRAAAKTGDPLDTATRL
jgi:serine/threonine protein kinase